MAFVIPFTGQNTFSFYNGVAASGSVNHSPETQVGLALRYRAGILPPVLNPWVTETTTEFENFVYQTVP